jgi:hypothetical protein
VSNILGLVEVNWDKIMLSEQVWHPQFTDLLITEKILLVLAFQNCKRRGHHSLTKPPNLNLGTKNQESVKKVTSVSIILNLEGDMYNTYFAWLSLDQADQYYTQSTKVASCLYWQVWPQLGLH